MEVSITAQELSYYEDELNALTNHIDLVFVGGENVKQKLSEISAHSVLNKIREKNGMPVSGAVGHMAFVGQSGTGKTMIAQMLGYFLSRLGYLEHGHVVKVTRHDLVGQYIGHTAPKTKEVVNSAMGGILYVKNAHNIYRPGNERDYGGEAIDILLQTMELYRKDFVLIFSGPEDKMNTLYSSNPGLSSRITHHVAFKSFKKDELVRLGDIYLEDNHLALQESEKEELEAYVYKNKRVTKITALGRRKIALEKACDKNYTKYLKPKVTVIKEKLEPKITLAKEWWTDKINS
jgi:AAA+ superfamily predicted ATPase